MKWFLRLLLVGAVALAPLPHATAQNVSGYDMMPAPFLLLLREPAVQEDLGLTREQSNRLAEINHSFDGELLATRNMPAEESREKIDKVVKETQIQVGKLFSDRQQDRMRQIAYRLRGISCVLAPHAAEELQLTSRQKTEIESIAKETRKKVVELQSGTFQGKETHKKSQKTIAAARKKEQKVIMGLLNDNQKRRLKALLGKAFDAGRLGHVSFKAPELSTGDEWINSEPLRFADLRGKVVALHFYAFGCGNCIRNYPWYREWNESFSNKGLVIIGVHTPETSKERQVDLVRDKVKEARFTFPVVVDNEKKNWNAWGNSMWPSVYLIDKKGQLRYWWHGELNWKDAGGQKIMGAKIDKLLAEKEGK